MRTAAGRRALLAAALAGLWLVGAGCRLEPSPGTTVGSTTTARDEGALADARRRLVREEIVAQGITDEDVLQAMERVPRHRFVPPTYRDQAYEDHPLPIGHGQTISQPTIVAVMTQALDLEVGDRVLEVGTGSGYQAAVLAAMGMQVYSVEIIGDLAERARAALGDAGYDAVRVRHGDGYLGWPEEAPFDAIIVTAAPDHVPTPLKDQLADGGRLVIPVGPVGGYQELWVVERSGEAFSTRSLGGVAFVPLTREER